MKNFQRRLLTTIILTATAATTSAASAATLSTHREEQQAISQAQSILIANGCNRVSWIRSADLAVNSPDADSTSAITIVGKTITMTCDQITEVEVTEPQTSVKVSWDIPTTRENSTLLPLAELSHYEIYYRIRGTQFADGAVVVIANPADTSVVINDLTAGRWYFAIAAVDTAGLYSTLSDYIYQDLTE